MPSQPVARATLGVKPAPSSAIRTTVPPDALDVDAHVRAPAWRATFDRLSWTTR